MGKSLKAMQIKNINIGQIRPYWRNPRKNDDTVVQIKRSIEEFGFNVPLVVDEQYEIIAGHARYRALIEMGVTEVPCVVSKMDKKLAKEYRIADNKTHDLSAWMYEGLAEEAGSREFLLSIPGFDEADAEGLFPTNIEPIDTDPIRFSGDGERLSNDGGGVIGAEGGQEEGVEGEASGEETEDEVVLMCPHCAVEAVYSKSVLLGEEQENAV